MNYNKFLRNDIFYLKLLQNAEYEGKYDMPKLHAVHNVMPKDLVPFHMINTKKEPSKSWFHFYEDDYQFERIWNNPSRYIEKLKQFEGGLGLDFSIYLGMPKTQQMWNCWRNKALTFHLQENCKTIIPNASWGEIDTLDWAFDGLPENSVLSITTQGCMRNNYLCKQSLLNGLHELIRQKHPESIIVYGRFPEIWKDKFPVPIFTYSTFAQERWGV